MSETVELPKAVVDALNGVKKRKAVVTDEESVPLHKMSKPDLIQVINNLKQELIQIKTHFDCLQKQKNLKSNSISATKQTVAKQEEDFQKRFEQFQKELGDKDLLYQRILKERDEHLLKELQEKDRFYEVQAEKQERTFQIALKAKEETISLLRSQLSELTKNAHSLTSDTKWLAQNAITNSNDAVKQAMNMASATASASLQTANTSLQVQQATQWRKAYNSMLLELKYDADFLQQANGENRKKALTHLLNQNYHKDPQAASTRLNYVKKMRAENKARLDAAAQNKIDEKALREVYNVQLLLESEEEMIGGALATREKTIAHKPPSAPLRLTHLS